MAARHLRDFHPGLVFQAAPGHHEADVGFEAEYSMLGRWLMAAAADWATGPTSGTIYCME